MDGPAVAATTAANSDLSTNANTGVSSILYSRGTRSVYFRRRKKLLVLAAKQGPELDKLLQMELGEDPKLTLAKVRTVSSVDGVNLVRPILKKGFKLEYGDEKPIENFKRSAPNVILRKEMVFSGEDVEEKPPGLRLKPNLSLKASNGQSVEKFSDMTLSRKPEFCGDVKAKVADDIELKMSLKENTGKPEAVQTQSNVDRKNEQLEVPEVQVNDDVEQSGFGGTSISSEMGNATKDELERLAGAIDDLLPKRLKIDEHSTTSMAYSCSSMKFSEDAALQGKSQRSDQFVRETSEPASVDVAFAHPGESNGTGISVEIESSLVASPFKDLEDAYWTRAEELLAKRKWERVELISASTRGFVVSFGPLVGFLPYNNLSARWKFSAFETWLRRKGLDPSMYWEKLKVIRHYGIANTNPSPEIDQKIDGEVSPDMPLEVLLEIHEKEKIKYLSSLIGQTPRVCLVMADRNSRKLMFSLKPRKDKEFVEKKRSLMAELQIGDVVKCHITKIAYYGVLVEVKGVPAMIHQTEISWDGTSEPSPRLKIGQILEARVHQLNFETERIFLSLKEITPDPLSDKLEVPISDNNPLDGRVEATEADTEWADVESLIKELQQIEGVGSASKGCFYLSQESAPTFQVHIASMFMGEYKLLAGLGNINQEVLVRASLDKEEMEAAILSFANRLK